MMNKHSIKNNLGTFIKNGMNIVNFRYINSINSTKTKNIFPIYQKSSCPSKAFSEKLKIKEYITLVDSDQINDEKEDWGDVLALTLDKENTARFYQQFKYIVEKGIILSVSDINKILSYVYNKNAKIADKIYNYIIENNIQLDSISYNYLILSALQFKNIHSGFYLFIEASLFNIPQNLSVIIALYKELYTYGTDEEIKKYQGMLDTHVKKFYSNDVIEILDSLAIQLSRKESIEDLDFYKSKKKRSKSEKSEKVVHVSSADKISNLLNRKNNKNNDTNEEITKVDLKGESENSEANAQNKDSNNESGLNTSNATATESVITTTPDSAESENNISSENTSSESNNLTSNKEETTASPNLASSTSSTTKKLSKKKEKRSKRNNYENSLDQIIGNGGIIVITQSLPQFEDDDGSESE